MFWETIGHSVKAGMRNGMEYGTEYGMSKLVSADGAPSLLVQYV